MYICNLLIPTLSCSMHPPGSRLKCGNVCGNRSPRRGMPWHCRRHGRRPSKTLADTPMAVACTSTSAKRGASPGSIASPSTDAGGTSAWAAIRPSVWLKLAGRRRTTGPPLRRVGIPWPKSTRLRCRPSGKPPVPSMPPTNPDGATPGTAQAGCRPWSVTPCRRWATPPSTG